MGFFEEGKVVVRKEDQEARNYFRRLERLREERESKELEDELDRMEDWILAGERIRKELEKTGMGGILLKELSLDYSGGNISLEYYLILPKMNVLVAYGSLEEALSRSGEQMKALKELKLRKASWLRRLSLNLYFEDFFRPLAVVKEEEEIIKDAPEHAVALNGLAEKLKAMALRSSAKSLPYKELEKEAGRLLAAHQEVGIFYQERYQALLKRMELEEGR